MDTFHAPFTGERACHASPGGRAVLTAASWGNGHGEIALNGTNGVNKLTASAMRAWGLSVHSDASLSALWLTICDRERAWVSDHRCRGDCTTARTFGSL